ncbi:MAG: STAS domain-containing protein [Actinobacteria bacterium]|nr:STAS domain-containing protein [Actinomycetota bacterium]
MARAEASSSPGARLRAGGPIRRDLVAGITVALVLVPQSLAYAQLAGVPAERGLYAAALPTIAAALVASSPYLQTGPVALTSLLTFGALSTFAAPGSGEYVGLAILLALVVGVVRVALGAARAGVLAYLMSPPMLIGFIPAAALVILAAQLPVALGVDAEGGGVLRDAATALADPRSWRTEDAVLAAATAAFVLGAARVTRLFPAVLVAVLAALAYSALADYGGATVGSIDAAVADPVFDLPWRELPSLLVPGIVIALVGFAEPASIARRFAAVERSRWDPNRELVSQGVANLAAGAAGGFPVGGSFSRSALNRSAGARTRWSGAVAGIAVIAFLPFARVLEPLPRAVLAGVVIAAVVELARILPLARLLGQSRPQFVVALATFVLTLGLAPRVDLAVVAAIALAVIVHLWRELELGVESWLDGETLHVRPIGVLWFASARRFEDAFLDLLADHREANRVVVHLDGLGRFDYSGALTLRRLLERARAAGLETEVVDVRPRAARAVARIVEAERDPLGEDLT